MAGISLRKLQKSFSDPQSKRLVTAVSDLDLEIHDGEFLVLVGPSGCGKSTTMRMIAGLEDPTGGEILVGDRVVNNVAPRDRNMAMVFQSYALYPHMSVYDNMAFGLRLRRLPGLFWQISHAAETREIKADIDRRVRETAEMLGLEDYLERKPKALSGGQRQRVALGRAIVREPQVFLMDEPLSNLDAQLRVQTRADLIKLHRRLGITTVYVTHDQVEAMTMGQRIAVMKDGVLQQCDKPLNLYHHPANMFVAGFLGTPSMNFIMDAHLRGDGAGGSPTRIEADSLSIQLPAARTTTLTSSDAGRAVVVGVRPQTIFPRASAPDAVISQGNLMRAQVEVIEPMGAISTLFLLVGSQNIVAEVDAETPAHEGDTLDFFVDSSSIHLFDPATEKAIL